MSRKYPGQNASVNTSQNREKQRYSHTASFHTAHLRREAAEHVQAKINSYRQSDPEGFARRQQAKNEQSTENKSSSENKQQKSSQGDPASTILGAAAAAVGEAIAGLTLTQVLICAGVAYGSYRLYKWWKAKPNE